MAKPLRSYLLILALLPACTPTPTGDDEVGVTTSPEGEDSGDDSSSEASSESSSSSSSSSSSTDDATDFVVEPDVFDYEECSLISQDCPEGEKCVAYSASGGGSWDATKCTPVIGDQGPGEPCIWDGIDEGTDDCDATSMCWDAVEVDGVAHGFCAPYCTGTPDEPMCPPSYDCIISGSGVLALCIGDCDPLLQDCNDGLGCYFDGTDFRCVSTTEDIPPGSPCGYVNDCAKGNICVMGSALPECAGDSCCTRYCDLFDPDCSSVPGTECVAFYDEGMAPPGYEDVGVCVVPD